MSVKIGTVKLRQNGQPITGDLYDNGTIVLPDGQKRQLDKKQFEELKKTMQATQEIAKRVPPRNESPYGPGLDVSDVDTFAKYDMSAEQKMKRRRIIKIFFAIFFAIVLVGVIFYLLSQYKPELIGLVPNSYKVAVANTDIVAGDTIEENEVAYIELSREEYTAQCVDTYMAENGAMKTDKPIFFVNAGNHIVGKFAAEDIAQGTIIKESMVTSQKFTGEVNVNGETQNVELTPSQLGGETNVTIIARIQQQDGTTQDVVLSSMKLQGRTLVDLVNGVGESILDSVQEEGQDAGEPQPAESQSESNSDEAAASSELEPAA